MSIDKPTLAKLRKFADVFKAARERNVDESNTVMYPIKFFEEVLGYDPLEGEITTEIPVKERYCDFAVVLGGKTDDGKPRPEFLVEAKAAHIKSLNEKHIEQAENYASRLPVNWVLLTNGIEWQLYHLTFDNGIQSDLVGQQVFRAQSAVGVAQGEINLRQLPVNGLLEANCRLPTARIFCKVRGLRRKNLRAALSHNDRRRLWQISNRVRATFF